MKGKGEKRRWEWVGDKVEMETAAAVQEVKAVETGTRLHWSLKGGVRPLKGEWERRGWDWVGEETETVAAVQEVSSIQLYLNPMGEVSEK